MRSGVVVRAHGSRWRPGSGPSGLPGAYLSGRLEHAARIDARQVHAVRRERVEECGVVEVEIDDGCRSGGPS